MKKPHRARLTLCLAYYDNPNMLMLQLERISRLGDDLRADLEVAVCDDGSPRWPATGAAIGCPLRIYRIGVDVRWNQDAARNICVHHTQTPWILLTDMDHLPSDAAWKRVLKGKLDGDFSYRFERVTLHPDQSMTPYKPHPNTWLMTRKTWDCTGGYDERFAGFYGTDADFRDRLTGCSMVAMLREPVIRVPRETVPDASTTTYERKSKEDGPAIRSIKVQRDAEVGWRPVTLRFPYELVYSSEG
jgi:hypothetical protein